MSFTPLLRRIREDKTNYRKRKAILLGRKAFAAVRLSNENVLVQVLKPTKIGDQVLASAHSRELIKHGWKGSRKNTPASYLTGLLAGKKAATSGVKGCVPYTSMRRFSPRIAAAVKGLRDAGVEIPVDEEATPSEERITGKHIVDYANTLKSDKEAYGSRFSKLLKDGFAPENYQDHFNQIKSSILKQPAVKAEKKVEKKKEAPKEAPKKQVPKKEPKKTEKKEPRKTAAKKEAKKK